MGWHTRGQDRGKSYQVYKELEAQHKRLQAAHDVLIVELERKNETIQSLARELAGYAKAAAPASPDVDAAIRNLVAAAKEQASIPLPEAAVPQSQRTPIRPLAKASPDQRSVAERLAELEAVGQSSNAPTGTTSKSGSK